jgi:hypothetical protein
MPTVLSFPSKRLRAATLRVWCVNARVQRVVCFSCGNASRELENSGLDVLAVGPGLQLETGAWWTAAEIRRAFPERLDLTSGHLPIELVAELGQTYRDHLGAQVQAGETYTVPTGSGETLIALALAYPAAAFVAEYDARREATAYQPGAPLNRLVERLAARVFWIDEAGVPRDVPVHGRGLRP